MAEATLKQVAEYFRSGEGGYESLSAFSKDWKLLSETDRAQIREGIGNGTLTY